MLSPFQIRDLSVSPPQEDDQSREASTEISSSVHGIGDDRNDQELAQSQTGPSPAVMQLSALEYDDLAHNHPRARLTYADVDDDGDVITVGSSLELAQRLNEPIDSLTEAESLKSMRLSQDDPTPMHIFDIRRSASVTELWKRFENKADEQNSGEEEESGAAAAIPDLSETPTVGNAAATSAPGDEPQPLLAAFEAELADMLSTTESSQNRSPRPESPPTVEPSASAGPGRTPHAIEILAAQVLRQLISRAGIVHSELRTRVPELQRQLHNAQQSLPENLGTSLQAVLTALENHMRNLTGAFHNIPEEGRQFAEEAIHAGRPVAENTANNLRMLASEVNDAGRTLFTAFENEFRRSAAGRPNSSTAEVQGTEPHDATHEPTASTEVPSPATDESHANGSVETENGTSNSAQPKVSGLGTNEELASPSDARHVNRQVQREGPVNSTPAPSGHHQLPHGHPHPPPASSLGVNTPAPPPFWQPPRSFWSGMPRFYPHPPPPPYPGRSWPFRSHPPPPHHWSGALQGPASHGPQNFSQAPPTPSASAHLRSAGTQTSSANKTLFIGNVGFNVSEKMIQDVFASKGFIVNVDLPKDTVSRKHAGFGYVNFPSIYPAMAAMEALQGAHIDGHAINLEFSDHSPIERVSPSQSTTPDRETAGRNAVATHPSTGSNDGKKTTLRRDSTVKPWSSALPTGSASGSSNRQVARQERVGSIIPRKSVAFSAPASSANDATANNTVNGTVELLDSTSDDPAFTARFPSLLPEGRPQHHGPVSKRDILPSLSPESEMNRFPPVSQLEAHLLANQRQGRTSGPTSAQDLNNGHGAGPSIYNVPSHEGPDSLPQDSQASFNKPEPRDLGTPPQGPRPSHHFGRGLRRSNTMMFAPSGSKHSAPSAADEAPGPGGLRRRATERHSLRSSARRASEMDTWARISRRERTRAMPIQSIPGSFPVDEPAQPTAPDFPTARNRESDEPADPIERCVSLLVDMGYGTVENGGRSRMAVYAAAAGGDLLEAIEMIEEERKAYKRHSRS